MRNVLILPRPYNYIYMTVTKVVQKATTYIKTTLWGSTLLPTPSTIMYLKRNLIKTNGNPHMITRQPADDMAIKGSHSTRAILHFRQPQLTELSHLGSHSSVLGIHNLQLSAAENK